MTHSEQQNTLRRKQQLFGWLSVALSLATVCFSMLSFCLTYHRQALVCGILEPIIHPEGSIGVISPETAPISPEIPLHP